MLQIKTFGLDDSEAANKFIKTARVIKDGIHFNEKCIIIEHDVLEEFGDEAKKDTLKTQLERAKLELFNAQMAKDFYNLMEAGGRVDTNTLQKKAEAFAAVEGAEAQIYLLSKALGLKTHGMSVFGKKQYESKEK